MREADGAEADGAVREVDGVEADSAVREGDGEADGETVSGHMQERREEGGLTMHA